MLENKRNYKTLPARNFDIDLEKCDTASFKLDGTTDQLFKPNKQYLENPDKYLKKDFESTSGLSIIDFKEEVIIEIATGNTKYKDLTPEKRASLKAARKIRHETHVQESKARKNIESTRNLQLAAQIESISKRSLMKKDENLIYSPKYENQILSPKYEKPIFSPKDVNPM